MRPPWVMLPSMLLAAAGPTNHIVDDADTQWVIGPFRSRSVVCYACTNATAYELSPDLLNNGTFTLLPWAGGGSGGASLATMQLTFNGTAIHVFVAVQSRNDAPLPQMGTLYLELDGVVVANYTPNRLPNESQYNISAFAQTELTDGEHTIILSAPNGGMLDYVLYTSSDPDTSSPTRGAPQIPSGATGSKKPRTAAIVGGIVAGIAAIFLSLVGLIFVRRARRNKGQKPLGSPPATDPLVLSKEPAQLEAGAPVVTVEAPGPDAYDHGLAQQMRLLTDEVQRLRQQVDGSSTVASSDSLNRSMSAMKREQTQAIQQHGLGTHVADSLVRTDSGIRLMASRAEEDLPPTYGAE
ncbi:hypothetical protein C8R47DRAFT_1269942 [Mycena vitilis]|nr:hypothetical protein C8R47DRAFT_1269942 [Mycena vitilis]